MMTTAMAHHTNSATELARMERKRIYAPNQAAIAALELTSAIAAVLTERFGASFASDVRARLQERAAALHEGCLEDHCTAQILSQMASWQIWSDTASATPE